MNEHDALFQSILESPDDDAPRLVYADWLEEHGQPERAEFIRLQIEADRTPFYEPRRAECVELAFQLLRAHANRASPPWQLRFPADMVPAPLQTFRRGFVESLELSDLQFLAVAAAVFGETPLCEAHFINFAGSVADLFASPFLHRLSAIDLSGRRMLAQADEPTLRMVRLPGLRRLGLANALTALELQALLRFAELPGLRELDLSHNVLGIDGLAHVANALQLGGLRVLQLGVDVDMFYSYRVRAAGIGHLARSPHLHELRELWLTGQQIGDAGLRALAESPNMARLELLDLRDNDIGAIGEAGLEAMATSPHLSSLRVLMLGDNPIGPAFRELLAWPGLGRLRYLHLAGCRLGEPHLWRLGEVPLADDVYLDVRNNQTSGPLARRLRERFGPRVSMDEPG